MANPIKAAKAGVSVPEQFTTAANILPRWAYLALALVCVCMGLWASYITLQYFEHGAKALETDKALQALAVAASLMFVASEMAAFGLAAVLTERQLRARSRMLTGFAAAVLALEVWTIVAVQLALTSGADLTQTTVQTQEKDLRARIAAIEADAAAKRATADQQRATAKTAYELHLAGKSSDKAAAEQAKTTALYDELKAVQTQKRPTLTGLMGEKTALAYAIARGILVSLGGLVFFGVAGALLRAARGGALSVDAQLVALLTELRDRPGALGAPVAPAQAVALAAPAAPAEIAAPAAPAQVSFKPAATVAPTGAPTVAAVGVSYGGRVMLAGAGALAAAAPVAVHAHAPAVPAAGASASASEQAHTSASEQAHLAETARHQAGASGASEKPGQSATEQAHPASASAGKTDAPKRARTATAIPDGDKLDSAVSGKGATRYNRVRAAVKSGKLKPSMRAIQAAEGGGGIVVRRYLQALEREGVIVKAGRGFVLVKKGGEA